MITHKIFYKKHGAARMMVLDEQHNLIEDVPADQLEPSAMESIRQEATSVLDSAAEIEDEHLKKMQESAKRICGTAGKMNPKDVLEQLTALTSQAYMTLQRKRGTGRHVPALLNLNTDALREHVMSRETFVSAKAPYKPMRAGDQKIMDRFLNLEEECFFEHCVDLRQALADAIEDKGGSKCPLCTRGRIENQYAEQALTMWRRQQEGKETEIPTGMKKVQVSKDESDLFARYRASVFGDAPCEKGWQGCRALHNACKKELANLSTNCTLCERDQVVAKYENLVLAKVQKLLNVNGNDSD